METTLSLYNNIKKACPIIPEMEVEEKNICLLEDQVVGIKECLIKLFDQGYSDYVNKTFKAIVNKPDHRNGIVYEVLVYDWLQTNFIRFELQPKICQNDCFKKNGDYEADGRICDVVFDVKLFGIGIPLLNKVTEEFQMLADADKKRITISGSQDLSNTDIQEILEKKQDIYKELKSDNYINHDQNIMQWKHGLEFRLYPIRAFAPFVGSFNSCEWAQNNELYFAKHGSQFCRNNPYMIFCPFDDNVAPLFAKDKYISLSLRFLCRRMFVNVSRFSDKMLHEYDGKAVTGISLPAAMRKVSAIIFMDVSQRWSYENCRMWVFVNPNADNPIKGYQIDQWFRQAGAYIEDFRYDNY